MRDRERDEPTDLRVARGVVVERSRLGDASAVAVPCRASEGDQSRTNLFGTVRWEAAVVVVGRRGGGEAERRNREQRGESEHVSDRLLRLTNHKSRL